MNLHLPICLTVILIVSANASAGLIHRWNFEEPAGTTAFDTVGSSDGTLVNMTGTERSSDTPFGIGKSLSFDASLEQHIDLGGSFITFDSDTHFSVSFWYKGTQVSQRNPWGAFGLLSWDSNGIHASLSLQSGKVQYSHFDGAWQTNITSTSSISTGEWNHVALVNYSDETADLWINGVKEIDRQSSEINSASMTSYFRIQHLMRGHSDGYIEGALDDVRIYDHALSSSEVTALNSVPEPSSIIAMLLAIGMLPIFLKARSVKAK